MGFCWHEFYYYYYYYDNHYSFDGGGMGDGEYHRAGDGHYMEYGSYLGEGGIFFCKEAGYNSDEWTPSPWEDQDETSFSIEDADA